MTSYASKTIMPVDSLFRTYCTQYEALYVVLITRSWVLKFYLGMDFGIGAGPDK